MQAGDGACSVGGHGEALLGAIGDVGWFSCRWNGGSCIEESPLRERINARSGQESTPAQGKDIRLSSRLFAPGSKKSPLTRPES